MRMIVALSAIFFLSTLAVFVQGMFSLKKAEGNIFLPKSRTEMIRGIAAIAIVFSHIASYSKGAAPSGFLRVYNNYFCTSLGGIGVNLFFFMSGYGNYFSALKRKKHIVSWLWNRIKSLLIIYIVCHVLVLCIMYAGGYRLDPVSILKNFVTLVIPYSSVWYLKIQLLVYFFLAAAIQFRERKMQIGSLALLSFLSTLVLYLAGCSDKWWKSTMCFAIGAVAAAFKKELAAVMEERKTALIILCIILMLPAYVAAILIKSYVIKTAGNAVLCILMMAMFQLFNTENKIFYMVGSYALHLYLIHRSLVAWILDDGKTTDKKVLVIVVLSVVFTLCAKWICDWILNSLLKKRR